MGEEYPTICKFERVIQSGTIAQKREDLPITHCSIAYVKGAIFIKGILYTSERMDVR